MQTMKFRLLVLLLLIFQWSHAQDEQLDQYQKANILTIKKLFQQQNIDKIAGMVNYPLRREYPIPSIKNKQEFKKRFHEVFDAALIKTIAQSKMDQWSEVGWRGIMLNNGSVWFESDGSRITTVNYQSDFEKKWRTKLIAADKNKLYPSLRKFETPVYKITTKNYLIRIDQLSYDTYRYASWKKGNAESSKPDIILTNGVMDIQGSGGNHVIVFTSGDYKYNVYRNIIGTEDSPDITLEVEKKGQIILTQDGTLLRN